MTFKIKVFLGVVGIYCLLMMSSMADIFDAEAPPLVENDSIYSKIRSFNLLDERKYTLENYESSQMKADSKVLIADLICCPEERIVKSKKKSRSLTLTPFIKNKSKKEKVSWKEQLVSEVLTVIGLDRDVLKFGNKGNIYIKVAKVSKIGVKVKF